MIWMISANGKMYDHASSFATNGFIDWRQRAKYNTGDIVYIYCTRPFMRIMYKCEVVQHSMPFSECIDDSIFWIDRDEYQKSKAGEYARLKLLEQVDTLHLCLENLKRHGLSAAPQGPIKVSTQLNAYIEKHFNDYYAEGFFSDVSKKELFHEGHVKSVLVNKYERSSIARGKCIEYHGDSCLICGINFSKEYGSLGNGFIHIHHMRPLHTIRKDYVVDYKKDLIPVCPNCHAMIHRLPNNENMSVEEIKIALKRITTSIDIEPKAKLQLSEISKRETQVLSKIRIGCEVRHKKYGTGKITKLDTSQKYVVVSFASSEKTFMIDAFDKGFLSLE